MPSITTIFGRHRAVALVLSAGLFLGALAVPAAAQTPPAGSTTTTLPPTLEDAGGDLKSQFDEISGKEAEVLQQLSDAQLARIKATADLAVLTRQTQAKQTELLSAQQAYTKAEHELQVRIAQRKRAEQAVRSARDRLRKQIVASYVTGGLTGGRLEAFLNAQNGEEVGQAITYGHAVSGSTESLVADLEVAQRARTRASKAANQARDTAASARDEIQGAAEFLVGARQQQQQLLTDLSVKAFMEAALLQQVQGSKALLEGQINSVGHASDGVALILAALQANQPEWTPGSVLITNPLPGVKVSSPFGMRHHPILGIDRLHAGADLGAPTGTPIHAAADGVVVLAEVRGGYGNAVVIDHGHSLATLYGHTSKMLVVPGQIVKRGDVIALVGSTGLSTGPHCHFETRIKGMPINPEGVVDFNAVVTYPQTGN
ncbi:peptidoglycan DD-metalloendopeptidase family protein [Aquihabitans sp. McL0605]|uniref:peptidoglycan DD-metalloendopeptidase family protein n=1 Tax=Aquihabitans sp. McL0605 TaxID=3415671 RepID=UPI003CF6B586